VQRPSAGELPEQKKWTFSYFNSPSRLIVPVQKNTPGGVVFRTMSDEIGMRNKDLVSGSDYTIGLMLLYLLTGYEDFDFDLEP
jgi:hypothetical protein